MQLSITQGAGAARGKQFRGDGEVRSSGRLFLGGFRGCTVDAGQKLGRNAMAARPSIVTARRHESVVSGGLHPCKSLGDSPLIMSNDSL